MPTEARSVAVAGELGYPTHPLPPQPWRCWKLLRIAASFLHLRPSLITWEILGEIPYISFIGSNRTLTPCNTLSHCWPASATTSPTKCISSSQYNLPLPPKSIVGFRPASARPPVGSNPIRLCPIPHIILSRSQRTILTGCAVLQ